jgi:hypothetical protein
MTDIEKARAVPCPGCKMPAGSRCVDIETGVEVDGVHQVRIYRAYVVAEADAHNRAIELEAEVERLRGHLAEVVGAFRRSRARGMYWHRGEVARALHRLDAAIPKETP